MRVALKKITCVEDAVREQRELIERCAVAANFLLVMFHRAEFSTFQIEDQRIILRTMSPRARQVWRDCE